MMHEVNERHNDKEGKSDRLICFKVIYDLSLSFPSLTPINQLCLRT
jgi:hypothetical protein